MRFVCFLASLAVISGCSAVVDPDDRLLDDRSDAGVTETDSGIVLPGRDSGPRPVDAGPPRRDAGPVCATGDRCEGDVLVSCRDGVEVRADCQEAGAFCEAGECRDWECTPGERACTEDLSGVLVCSPRGDGVTTMPCEGVCDPVTDTCTTVVPTCPGLPSIGVGDVRTFDLCGETDDDTYVVSDGCRADARADVGDRTFVLTLEHATDLVIELSDSDGSAAIDTVVYVRTVCDQPDTQVACHDDVPCEESTIPIGSCSGVEVRQSRIRTRLEAGTYYIVADAFEYARERMSFGCGTVRLRVSTP